VLEKAAVALVALVTNIVADAATDSIAVVVLYMAYVVTLFTFGRS